jgi:hypothetical protein
MKLKHNGRSFPAGEGQNGAMPMVDAAAAAAAAAAVT